jgi:hypothetical protein
MNNTNATVIQNVINKLPPNIFFESLPDRKQAIKYLQWLNTNVPEAKAFNNQDQFLREIIAKELRIVSMKIIEIEILLMVGLNNITLDDFSIDSKTLIKKLISENPDKYDLDIMYRILAQIMTKLPRDLKERVTGKQKLEIFQKLTQYSNIDNALIEKFIAYDQTINTPVSMELDSGDYDILNKQYLNELHKYEQSKGYVDNNSIEFATIATNMVFTPDPNNQNLKSQYIDNNPDFMLGQNDNTLYYYDESSGTLSEIPIKETQTPVSIKDLKVVLTGNKVKKGDVQNLINGISPKPAPTLANIVPTTTEASGFFSSIGSYFTSSKSTDATATTSSTSTFLSTPDITVPMPPQYIQNQVKKNYISENKANGGSASVSGSSVSGSSVGGSSVGGSSVGGSSVGGSSIGGSSIGGSSSNSITNDSYGKLIIQPQEGDIMINSSMPRNTNNFLKSNAPLPNQPVNNLPNKPNPTIDKILESQYKERQNQYEAFTSSIHSTDTIGGSTSTNEDQFLKKIKNDNKNIENVALGFVVLIILVFLLVIFNSIRNNSGKSK